VDELSFGTCFPNVSLATDSHAANRMNTNHGGAYVAAGVGTAVTGRGAHIALIDDPFKDREEADSERRRDLVWDWYRSTLFTRLMPGGAIVLIQTRWHEDDLGRTAAGGEPIGKSSISPRSMLTARRCGLNGMTNSSGAHQEHDRPARMVGAVSAEAAARRRHVLSARLVQGMGQASPSLNIYGTRTTR
jgi:hypothetical protein